MIHSIIKTWNLKNKCVFLRADLNAPLNEGSIANDFRLQSVLPTLDYILDQGGTVILATHIGKPVDHEPELSTQHLIPWFEQRGYSIVFVRNISAIIRHIKKPKQIILIENLRFFPEEKNGDLFFAKQLASTAEYYVNDAFGAIHRNDCSIAVLPYEFPENKRSIGFLIEKELYALSVLKDNPQHPFIAIVGGKKIEDKIPLIEGLLSTVDALFLCPALCFSFVKALHQPVGKSLIDDTLFSTCTSIISQAENKGIHIILPLDYQIAANDINGPLSVTNATDFPDNAVGISIGPKTVDLLSSTINQAKTIFLNCSMGFADRPETRQSTYAIINAMTKTSATTIIAGGDSVEAAFNSGAADLIDHLSTGGGAALAYLSNNLLPGLAAFEEQ